MKTIFIVSMFAALQLTAQTKPIKSAKKVDTANTTLQQSKKLQDHIPLEQKVTMESIEAEKMAQYPKGYYKVEKDVSGKDKNMIGSTPK